MCDCKSYNLEVGFIDEVVLFPPFQSNSVCVDWCISELIQKVWSAGIVTRGSCCGHNGFNDLKPSIILDESTTPLQIDELRMILKDNSSMDFSILIWKDSLVEL